MNKFAVAPMIDWTDRHCRHFHRLLSKNATLYTEMVVDQAILRGDRERILDIDADKENVVLQIGGSEPKCIGEATRIAFEAGYREINLNCGCPSDRVQAGTFGAVLMNDAERVKAILEEMQNLCDAKISIKIRLGIDEQIVDDSLPLFLETVLQSGIDEVTIHARKAWLKGLSPKDNRSIPPLDYDLAARMKIAFPTVKFALNGGIETLDECVEHLERFDGVMLGRAPYKRPYDVLVPLDQRLYGSHEEIVSREKIIDEMTLYLDEYVAKGGRVHSVTRHMQGLFHGQKGGRIWRAQLAQLARHNDPKILQLAYAEIQALGDEALNQIAETGT